MSENKDPKTDIVTRINELHLPRYKELPTVGLYLEQVVKYINVYLCEMGCSEITGSMVSNYVKKGFVAPPVKKQYYPEHIAYLIFIALTKNILPLDSIGLMFDIQKRSYTTEVAYNYFCTELENMLSFVFKAKETPDADSGVTDSEEKGLLYEIVTSVAFSVRLSARLDELNRSMGKNKDNDKA